MTWAERIEQIGVSVGGAIGIAVVGGLWWIARTFFTDRSRLTFLEREMQARIARHDDLKEHIEKLEAKIDRLVERAK